MTTEIDAQFEKMHQAFTLFRRALASESDRGCALFAAAYLDDALANLLRALLVQGRALDEELFRSTSPLGTFSSRIKFAYYMGKISPQERRDLETIRSIRNTFAHTSEAVDFETQSIRDRCANLSLTFHTEDARARAKFTSSVTALLARVHMRTARATAATEHADTPIPERLKEEVRQQAMVEAAKAQKQDLFDLLNRIENPGA